MASTFPEDHPVTCKVLERTVFSKFAFDEEPPEQLLDAAHQVGIFPTVYRYFQRNGYDLPQSAEERWRRHLLRLATLRGRLAQILELLEPDVDILLLKGEPLGELLFGDRRARQTTDIDLLIHSDQVETAAAYLEEAGYTPDDEQRPPDLSNQLRMIHPEKPGSVELHWLLAQPWVPSPRTAELFESRETFELDQIQVDYLCDENLLLHLFLHFHNHMGQLKELLDLAGWLDRHPNRTALLQKARTTGEALDCKNLLDWPLLTIDEIADCSFVPDTPSPAARALANMTTTHLLSRGVGGWPVTLPNFYQNESGGTPFTVLLRLASVFALDTWSDRLSATKTLTVGKFRRHLRGKTDSYRFRCH